MANCRQACPYNTLYGCKVKEYNAICPLTNMATPITEYKMTNADRIRSMSDEELEEGIRRLSLEYEPWCDRHCKMNGDDDCNRCLRIWLQQPAEMSIKDDCLGGVNDTSDI